ncbi:hypothetical protein P700755_000825 [Psychroflexus torquis ATCC 700755]|uniref:Uncharacterized protein n=1 Tax=Psychroflexus torquis (strain ATCC 700755 / CIP 106069 / ACAM 623) TaxID=313595 RepID=K4IBK6_PSYTT|nr:hypothetical protein [Psychroflexus torquis]AFU67819.1 hypothetical protein P700755_000825 [Psychroflexus torquis ATCC 700755]
MKGLFKTSIAIATLATLAVNAESVEEHNAMKAEIHNNLSAKANIIKNDVLTVTKENLKRIKPEFTPKERAMIKNVSTKLATLRDAVLTATSDDERTTAQTSLDNFRATDPELAKLVIKRAELLAKADEEKRLARYILTVPDQLSDSPSQETLADHDKFSDDHSDKAIAYNNMARKLSFLEAKNGISTIENKSAEVVAWEKEHHMEITENKEWRSIVVVHNGNTKPVSNIVSISRIKGTPSINVSGETLVFTYSDAIKENNVILYYLENNNLMQKTENSGTRPLFEVSN